jgi:PAS domain S-box-containing protein
MTKPVIEDECYKTIIQNALDGFVLVNAAWEIIEVNAPFCSMLGYSRDELLSMNIREIHEVPFAKNKVPNDINFDDLDGKHLQIQVKNIAGWLLDFEVGYQRLNNVPGLLCGFYQDITERNRIYQITKNSEEEYHSLFDNAPVGIWEGDYSAVKAYIDRLRALGIQDFDLYFRDHPEELADRIRGIHSIRFNRFAQKMNLSGSVPAKDDEWNHWVKYDQNRLTNWEKGILSLIKNEQHGKYEVKTKSPDGGYKFIQFESYIPPAYLDTWSKVIFITTDITDLKNTEEQLRHNQEHLEDLVRERTKELEQSRERAEVLYRSEQQMHQALQEQIQQRVDFTRALVHELKTPLTPMIVASDILSSMLEPGTAKIMAEEIQDGASTLNKRIDELLDVARGEIGMLKLDAVPCDLLQTVKEVSQYSACLFKSRNQAFRVDLPGDLPVIQADPQRIRQVLINLLDNASKYTQRGGEIILRAYSTLHQVTVEVEDNGLGIPPNKRDKLFILYSMLATRGQSMDGIGLGLALCKMLITLHSGEIWVKDNPQGKGCIFGFSLPFGGGTQ